MSIQAAANRAENHSQMLRTAVPQSEVLIIAVCCMQIVNRDLSIAMLKQFIKQLKVERETGKAPRVKSRAKGAVMVNPAQPQEKV